MTSIFVLLGLFAVGLCVGWFLARDPEEDKHIKELQEANHELSLKIRKRRDHVEEIRAALKKRKEN